MFIERMMSMKNRKKFISLMLCLSMMVGMLAPGFSATAFAEKIYSIPGLEIETAFDPDFGSEGQKKTIDFVNPDFANSTPAFPGQAISLFTPGNRAFISNGSINTNTAIVVDSNMTVIKVINKAPAPGAKPSFTESTDVTAPEGGFVLLACDTSYATAGYKKFLAEKFNVGDVVKIKLNNAEIGVKQLLQLLGQNEAPKAVLTLNYKDMYTTADTTATVSGVVSNMGSEASYKINIKQLDANNNVIGESSETIVVPDVSVVSGAAIGMEPSAVSGSAIVGLNIDVNEDGTFSREIPLQTGVNYIDVAIIEDGILLSETTQSMIIFKKDQITVDEDKQVVMWIDQYASAKSLNTVEKIEKMVNTAKNAGVTAFAFDVKGTEGYASYKKATITNVPYMTETKNPNKYVDMDIDFLEEMIKASHSLGIKLYASFNFFTEGNLATNDYAIDIKNEYRDWAEVFQTPEDKGELKSILDSSRNSTLIYVNPANDEVRQFQLDRVEEVLMNYDVDGVIMDRARYDNQYADFSEETKVKFVAYLEAQGKTLVNWPADAYKINVDGSMTTGSLYNEWLAFRSSIIGDFAADLKELVNEYKSIKEKDITLSAYVGSWYEVYYQNGVNWADESFIYNDRLKFPQSDIYTPEYRSTSYVDSIDFLMIGCYYDTEAMIAKYTTLGNVLTNGKIPLIGSIDLTSLKTPESQRIGYQAAFDNSDGAMIFDLCYVDWYMIECAIKDKVYENPYTISAYNPLNKDIITINNMNTSRAEDTIVLYNEEFGDTTGTNQWGVEVVVDASGTVTHVANKKQAIDWVWGDATELNNSVIPENGFVLSSADKSGSRVLRQLLANGFSVGDKTAVAYITDYLQYNSILFNRENEELTFVVRSWGSTDSEEVFVNGKLATLKDATTGTYSIPVKLKNGDNDFKVEVYVNKLKTLEKEIIMIGNNITSGETETIPTPTPPVTPVPPTPTPGEEETVVTTIKEKDKNGANIVAQIESDKEGNVLSAIATLEITKSNKTGVSSDKKTSYIRFDVQAEGILKVTKKLRELSKDATLDLEIKLPEKDVLKQLKDKNRNAVSVFVVVPSTLTKNNVELTSVVVPENILKAAKEANKDLYIRVQDENKNIAYTWRIGAKNLNISSLSDGKINVAIKMSTISDNADIQAVLKQDTNNKTGIVLSFSKEGKLPSSVKVNIYIGSKINKGKKVYLYGFNKETNKLEELLENQYAVNKNGYFTMNVNNDFDYVVLDKKPNNKIVTPLMEQVKTQKK
jgi:uncharacterized lipoprotein YddW (UPF0748 family)